MAKKSRTRKRSLRRKGFYSLVVFLLFFAVIESILAVFGVAPPAVTEDMFVGFQPGQPLFVRDGDRFVTCLVQLGDNPGARQSVSEALEIDPTSENARQAYRELFH